MLQPLLFGISYGGWGLVINREGGLLQNHGGLIREGGLIERGLNKAFASFLNFF